MHQERCARRAAWDLSKQNYMLKNVDKATSLIEAKVMPAKVMSVPTSKSPEERDFVVDSGASMHVLRKISSDELDTLRRSRNPVVVLTANGEVHTHEEAQVFVHDLNLFVSVQLRKEKRLLFCEDHGRPTWFPSSNSFLYFSNNKSCCGLCEFIALVERVRQSRCCFCFDQGRDRGTQWTGKIRQCGYPFWLWRCKQNSRDPKCSPTRTVPRGVDDRSAGRCAGVLHSRRWTRRTVPQLASTRR